MKKIGLILSTLLVPVTFAVPMESFAMEEEEVITEVSVEEVTAVEAGDDSNSVLTYEVEFSESIELQDNTDILEDTALSDEFVEDTENEENFEEDTDNVDDSEKDTENVDEYEEDAEFEEDNSEELEENEEEEISEEDESELLEEDLDINDLFDATYAELNQSEVFIKQATSYTCTLASATMMLRRAALLDGKDWESITESAVRTVAWTSGLSWNFSYAGYAVYGGTYIGSLATSEKWNTLRDLLAAHPEGIVAYNGNDEHAVLLTDYLNGTFYCVDPSNDPSVGRIALRNAYKITGPSSITRIWYILSPSVTPPTNVNLIENTPTDSETETETETETTVIDEEKVSGFVTRLYENVLNRTPDSSGLTYWINKMKTGEMNGSEVADSFVNSTELTARNLSDSNYIDMLYKAFMDRSADSSGKTYWTNILNVGMSRYYVFAGFANSSEFAGICKDYGIDQGEVLPTEARDLNVGITSFVSRLYTQCLNRTYDVTGLNDWCKKIYFSSSKRETAVSVALQFFTSNEFLNNEDNADDSTYIKILYKTFLNRESDSTGLNYWLNQLKNGKTREDIIKGFAASTEFNKLMDKYNID